MKRIFLFCLAVGWLPISVFSQETTAVKSEIEKVTVFLRGAQVERMAAPSVATGTTFLSFEGLSPYLDPNSIQVKGTGEVTILSVKHQLNHMTEKKKSPRIVQLEDSLKDARTKLAFTEGMQSVHAEEEKMVLANNKVKGENTVLNIEDMEDVADFYRSRLSDIKLKQIELTNKRTKLAESINRMTRQLNELNAQRASNRSEIVVEVAAKSATRPKLTVSYMIYNAGWTPIYDLRAKDTNGPVTLNYKANVVQNTGIDWDNVDLVLSTGNPSLGGTAPQMEPWRLQLYEPYDAKSDRNKGGYRTDNYLGEEMAAPSRHAAPMMLEDKAIATSAEYTTAVETAVNTEFRISRKYSIPSDNKEHMVYVQDSELAANYRHFAIPKLDKSAFLLARITGWDELSLLPGQANIYFEGTYVGQSFLDPNVTNDTLDFSLGRDNGVVITREVIWDFSEKKNIGSNRKISYGYEITVRNTKGNPINLKLQDQLPLTSNKEVEVEVIEISGAKRDETTGILTWETPVPRAETKKFVLKYTVKYPKGKMIR